MTFSIAGTAEDLEEATVLLCSEEGDSSRRLEFDTELRAASAELLLGTYSAAVLIDEMGCGPVRTFAVDSSVTEVALEAPYQFDLSFPVLSAETLRPVADARVTIERSDLRPGWTQPAVAEVITDQLGTARLIGMTPGRWRLRAEAIGFGADETDFDYPGAQETRARKDGLVTLDAVYLAVLRTVRFRLVDHEQWTDLTGFTVAHTHEGVAVPFSAEGEARIELGWHDLPLYIKLTYPDDRECVRYLDGGLPDEEGVHEIAVGGERELEVRVDASSAVMDAIAEQSSRLSVSFRDINGDAAKVGAPFVGPGLYVFETVQVDRATISLESSSDGPPTHWATSRVILEDQGRTSAELFIDDVPARLRVTDGAGAPVGGFHFEVRMVPDDTTWASGGVTGSDGMCGIARVLDATASLCGFVEHGPLVTLAIDLPIDLGMPDGAIEVELAPVESTFVEIVGPEGSTANLGVQFSGTDTGHTYHWDSTDRSGRTRPFQLVTDSRVRARLELGELWSPTPEFDLRPGRNAALVRETGVLRVSRSGRLVDVRSVEFGAHLDKWRSDGLLRLERTPGGAVLCRVPVGSYEVTMGDGETQLVRVRSGVEAPSGI
ncbi:MAG: carboxypeptidase-like regulatory domain-containing protein [Planctomycetota bacterium]